MPTLPHDGIGKRHSGGGGLPPTPRGILFGMSQNCYLWGKARRYRGRRRATTAPFSRITWPGRTRTSTTASSRTVSTSRPIIGSPPLLCPARGGATIADPAGRLPELLRRVGPPPKVVTQRLRDSFGRMTVAVRVAGARHGLVRRRIGEQAAGLGDDARAVGPHQTGRPRLDPLRSLRHPAQYQDRLAQRRGFLLNAAGIGEDEVGPAHQVHPRRVVRRFD